MLSTLQRADILNEQFGSGRFVTLTNAANSARWKKNTKRAKDYMEWVRAHLKVPNPQVGPSGQLDPLPSFNDDEREGHVLYPMIALAGDTKDPKFDRWYKRRIREDLNDPDSLFRVKYKNYFGPRPVVSTRQLKRDEYNRASYPNIFNLQAAVLDAQKNRNVTALNQLFRKMKDSFEDLNRRYPLDSFLDNDDVLEDEDFEYPSHHVRRNARQRSQQSQQQQQQQPQTQSMNDADFPTPSPIIPETPDDEIQQQNPLAGEKQSGNKQTIWGDSYEKVLEYIEKKDFTQVHNEAKYLWQWFASRRVKDKFNTFFIANEKMKYEGSPKSFNDKIWYFVTDKQPAAEEDPDYDVYEISPSLVETVIRQVPSDVPADERKIILRDFIDFFKSQDGYLYQLPDVFFESVFDFGRWILNLLGIVKNHADYPKLGGTEDEKDWMANAIVRTIVLLTLFFFSDARETKVVNENTLKFLCFFSFSPFAKDAIKTAMKPDSFLRDDKIEIQTTIPNGAWGVEFSGGQDDDDDYGGDGGNGDNDGNGGDGGDEPSYFDPNFDPTTYESIGERIGVEPSDQNLFASPPAQHTLSLGKRSKNKVVSPPKKRMRGKSKNLTPPTRPVVVAPPTRPVVVAPPVPSVLEKSKNKTVKPKKKKKRTWVESGDPHILAPMPVSPPTPSLLERSKKIKHPSKTKKIVKPKKKIERLTKRKKTWVESGDPHILAPMPFSPPLL